jgi:putative membrane protein
MDVVYQAVFLGEFFPGGGGDRGLAGVRSLCSLARAYTPRCAPLDRPTGLRLTDWAFGEGKVGDLDIQLDVNTELASRRTGMAFQRTRLAEDRTLMAVIRTSLSLIGFGFTIYQFFQRLREQDVITRAAAPRHFGLALVALGVLMLFLGIVYHVQFMLGLRRLRQSMHDDGLIHGETVFPLSLTLITAFLLLIVGVAAILSMEFQIGPFG